MQVYGIVGLCLVCGLPAAAQEMLQFRTPSDNIHCMINLGEYAEVRCDMKDLTPSFTTAPPDCDLDWGSSFVIVEDENRGQLACAGDTIIQPGAQVLGYGETVSLGEFSCTSEKSGLTCTNAEGHGFTLSKAKQTLF